MAQKPSGGGPGATAPVWSLPATLNLMQGGQLDIRQYATDADGDDLTFTHESGDLPTGVTFSDGVFVAAADATLGESGDITLGADDGYVAPEPAALPTFGLTSAVGGSDLPFTFGHVFAKGDVPAGSYVDSDLTDWQAVPTTYWPDGSVRHAIVSGKATCTKDVLKSVQLSASTTARSGAPLTEADLAAALPTTTLAAGAETITLGDLVGTAALHRTVCTGPVMSNWLYRKQLAGSDHVVVWFDVRLYKGGSVEVFPWIENGYLLVAGPTNDVRSYTLTIGGVEVFSATDLDIKHHTRVVLMTGAAHSYWTADPQITPKHDTVYMRASKMVPNYAYPLSDEALDGTDFPTTYTPNWLGRTPAAMGQTGYGPHIGILPAWQAGFIANAADPRAYNSVIANAMASGSWHSHYRDESTNEPFLFTDWPSVSTAWSGSPSIPSGTGGVNVDAGGTTAKPDCAHQPSFGFLPWLLTGRWFFLDEQLFWATWSYLQGNQVTREGASAIMFDGQVRGRGWQMRSLAQLLAILPESHASHASIKAAWEANTAAYEARYVTGTRDSGAWANNLGVMGLYSSATESGVGTVSAYGKAGNFWWDAPWMQDTLIVSWGTAWDMDLPQSTASKASLLAIRDHGYKHAVGPTGDGSTGTYFYRRFGSYKLPYGTDYAGAPPEAWLSDWGEVYTAFESYAGAGGGPLAALPEGTSIYYEDAPFNEGHWSYHSAGAFHLGSLVYAVEHGAPGAAEGYARITAASNYTTSGFASIPIWSFVPRTA